MARKSKHALTRDHAHRLLDKHGNFTAAAKAIDIPVSTFKYIYHKSDPIPEPKIDIISEHRLVQENKALKKQISELTSEESHSKELIDLISEFTRASLNPPKWATPKTSGKKERGIITAQLSDTHFDEVVRPEQINFINGYNRKIAVARLQTYFDSLIRLSRDYINGIKIEGLTLQLLGDMVSGNIHEELKETNDAHILETCLFWANQIAAGIKLLTSHFSDIYIVCTVGNHGRLDKKPKHKFRAQDNFDWLIYNVLALHLKDEKDITFSISEGADFAYDVYSTRYMCTHGDQFRGGSGIAGMLSPLMIGDYKKRKREASIGMPYDYLCIGHWHQFAHFKGVLANGSLIGYNEFAANNNFEPEPPQQGFWITDPRRGKALSAPIHVLNFDEYWMDKSNDHNSKIERGFCSSS